MAQEQEEELKDESGEHAPASDDTGTTSEEPVIEPGSDQQIEESGDLQAENAQLKADLAKEREEKENYRKGLLAEKEKKRKDEIDALANPSDSKVEADPFGKEENITSTSTVASYQDKRSDVAEDIREKIRDLSDREYEVFKTHLAAQEQLLLGKAKSTFVSRREIKEMFDEALEYAAFRTGKTRPKSEEESETTLNADMGPTRTTVRRGSGIPQPTEEDRKIASRTGVKGDVPLTAEQVQNLRKKGYRI